MAAVDLDFPWIRPLETRNLTYIFLRTPIDDEEDPKEESGKAAV